MFSVVTGFCSTNNKHYHPLTNRNTHSLTWTLTLSLFYTHLYSYCQQTCLNKCFLSLSVCLSLSLSFLHTNTNYSSSMTNYASFFPLSNDCSLFQSRIQFLCKCSCKLFIYFNLLILNFSRFQLSSKFNFWNGRHIISL